MTEQHSATVRVGETAVPAGRLTRFAQEIFERAGMRPADAGLLADHLVWADLRGLSRLGVGKIPQYVARLRAGGTSAGAVPVAVVDRAAFLLLDGRDTWGQVVGARAMEIAVEKARSAGAAVAVVRNTTSAGALGYFAMLAVRERMIGMAVNNSPPLQSAPGGTDRAIGNQAFAIATPAGRHAPLLLDTATSAMTLARIHDYEHRGERLPQGVALTADGVPTTDPAAALAGILLPMGGHRGFGLALAWEVLTGVLAGGARFAGNVTMPDISDRPQGVSMFLLAINPEIAMTYDAFISRVDGLIDQVHASAPAPGTERVTVPGERGYATATRRQRDGIPLPADLAAKLNDLGEDLGVSLARPLPGRRDPAEQKILRHPGAPWTGGRGPPRPFRARAHPQRAVRPRTPRLGSISWWTSRSSTPRASSVRWRRASRCW